MSLNQCLAQLGYERFRPHQEDIVNSILKGDDALVVLRTGGGKSACYIIPALMTGKITVVISPLIALMQDQVASLHKKGVSACFLGYGQAADAFSGRYLIVYTTPESLHSQFQNFLGLHSKVGIGLFAIDEAHCISKWGHDFRPKYLEIGSIRESSLRDVPIAAFTATATPKAQTSIVALLKLRKPSVFVASFNRPNIKYVANRRCDNSGDDITPILRTNDIGRTKDGGKLAIIYCTRRDVCEKISKLLTMHGYEVGRYHGGMDGSSRCDTLDKFLGNSLDCIVATNAFGMGIDKANVRVVINYGMPKSLEAFYQESGRAGRDEKPATSYLLYSKQDFVKNIHHLKGAEPERRGVLKRSMNDMFDYVGVRTKCRRKHLLEHFGDKCILQDRCCDLCSNIGDKDAMLDVSDFKNDLHTIYETILQVQAFLGYTFGVTRMLSILCGSKTKAVWPKQLNEQSFYGCGELKSKSWWSKVMEIAMAVEGFIGQNEHNSLKVESKDVPLRIVRSAYMEKLIGRIRSKPPTRRRAPNTNTNTKTRNVTLEWVKLGLSLNQIADKRKLKTRTIAKHIVDVLHDSKEGICIDKFVDKNIYRLLRNIMSSSSVEAQQRLRTLKDALETSMVANGIHANVSYDQIQIARAHISTRVPTEPLAVMNCTSH